MGLDLWFRDDVARIIASAWESYQATASSVPVETMTESEQARAYAYGRGWADALRAMSVAFGLSSTYAPDHDGLRFDIKT